MKPLRHQKTPEQIMAAEGQRILPHINRASYTIALSERGDMVDSPSFSNRLAQCIYSTNPPNGGTAHRGNGPIIVVVGGALGLCQTVLERADWILSLSRLTFPHPMVRLIVAEQLFRAVKIMNNEPYHK